MELGPVGPSVLVGRPVGWLPVGWLPEGWLIEGWLPVGWLPVVDWLPVRGAEVLVLPCPGLMVLPFSSVVIVTVVVGKTLVTVVIVVSKVVMNVVGAF